MSRRFFWSVIVAISIMVGTVMCLPAPCYYHREEDCAVLCATSGLLRRANERSLWWRRGRRALWICRAPVQQSKDKVPATTTYCTSVSSSPTFIKKKNKPLTWELPYFLIVHHRGYVKGLSSSSTKNTM